MAQFGSFELDCRLWRIQGKRKGAAVNRGEDVYRRPRKCRAPQEWRSSSANGQKQPLFFEQLNKYSEVWLSLVERYVRDVEVAGSNPVTSTSREPRHAFRVVEALFLILLFLAACQLNGVF